VEEQAESGRNCLDLGVIREAGGCLANLVDQTKAFSDLLELSHGKNV